MIAFIVIGLIVIIVSVLGKAADGKKPKIVPVPGPKQVTREKKDARTRQVGPSFLSLPHPATEDPPASIYAPEIIYPELDIYTDSEGNAAYPPDWSARKSAVKQRDGNRCQVTGCLTLCPLDVHHITPIHQGGSHHLDNLVCLCLVHHWLLPQHSLVAERTDCPRFSMRRAHTRWHPSKPERVRVRATFERYVTSSVSDCEAIRDQYGLQCAVCGSDGIHFAELDRTIFCACLRCRGAWELPRLLPEEIGPLLLDYCRATANLGAFTFDITLLGEHPKREVELCGVCADQARIGILIPRSGQYGSFKGCTNFKTTGCRNTDQKQQYRHRIAPNNNGPN